MRRTTPTRAAAPTVMILMMAALTSACALAPAETPGAGGARKPSVSVFTVAHQDDWQLFMNPEAYHAMNEPGEKAVFIHVTAGDAGAGAGGEPVAYYLAREEGSLRAIRFMANAADPSQGRGFSMDSMRRETNGKLLQRYAYANAVVYFLRLPDGFIVRNGVFTPHPASLTRLRAGEAASAETIEGGARYEGWADLVATLRTIIRQEDVAGADLRLHIAELDEALNPGDHPDHRAVASAMEEVALDHPCARVYRHVEYHTREKAPNISGDDLMIDIGTWAATASGLSDNYAPSTWDGAHNAWIGRSYARLTPPSAACSQDRQG